MAAGEEKQTPPNPKVAPKQQSDSIPVQGQDSVFSPGFRSIVAMAGWDEEALLLASFVVEDTPERDSKHKKRFCVKIKSPPQSSTRKRRAQRRSLVPAHVINLDLEEEETVNQVCQEKNPELETESSGASSSSSSGLPCMDKLKEELSCAICLEICYEPSTTPCGHSFCRKCLRSAADKCGKRCPKCRQLISNARSCTVNTILWNTIQLLFPQEVEARSHTSAGTSNIQETGQKNSETALHSNVDDDQSIRIYRPSSRVESRRDARSMRNSDEIARRRRRRRGMVNQDEAAALALRLQREAFMEVFGGSGERSTRYASVSRTELRALASRAMSLRVRGHHV